MNIFLSHPDLLTHETIILAVRDMPGDKTAFTTTENIVRSAGGGQPADASDVTTAAGTYPVEGVFKADGKTWLVLNGPVGTDISVDSPVMLHVDPLRRERLSRCHSLTHLAMAAVKEQLPGYQSKGADIADDATTIELRFLASVPLAQDLINSIDRRTRSLISQAIPISVERARSMLDAEELYAKWRVDPDLNLSGKIRVINIEGIDVNPCSGSHVGSTDAIGPYGVEGHNTDSAGVHRLLLKRFDCWMYWL
jgi:misacylated tRNA(Ala) deacylase